MAKKNIKDLNKKYAQNHKEHVAKKIAANTDVEKLKNTDKEVLKIVAPVIAKDTDMAEQFTQTIVENPSVLQDADFITVPQVLKIVKTTIENNEDLKTTLAKTIKDNELDSNAINEKLIKGKPEVDQPADAAQGGTTQGGAAQGGGTPADAAQGGTTQAGEGKHNDGAAFIKTNEKAADKEGTDPEVEKQGDATANLDLYQLKLGDNSTNSTGDATANLDLYQLKLGDNSKNSTGNATECLNLVEMPLTDNSTNSTVDVTGDLNL